MFLKEVREGCSVTCSLLGLFPPFALSEPLWDDLWLWTFSSSDLCCMVWNFWLVVLVLASLLIYPWRWFNCFLKDATCLFNRLVLFTFPFSNGGVGGREALLFGLFPGLESVMTSFFDLVVLTLTWARDDRFDLEWFTDEKASSSFSFWMVCIRNSL